MGATLPGCPIMAVGRTHRLIAWGVTYMHADTSDFFIEDCRPGGTTGWQYRRGDRWFDFQRRQEVIRRKGDEPLSSTFTRTNKAFSAARRILRKVPASIYRCRGSGNRVEGGRAISTWLDVIAAPSTAAAMEAVRSGAAPVASVVVC